MYEILKENNLELLKKGVFRVLEQLGMVCQNKEILKALEERGAKVDYEQKSAKFPERMVQEFVGEIRKENKTAWREKIKGKNQEVLYSGYVPPLESPNEFIAPLLPSLFHPLATFFYDDDKKEKRPGNKADFIRLVKLGEVLHPEQGVGHTLILSDVPSPIEPLEAALLLLEHSHNPRGVYLQDIRQADYLMEIAEIFGIKDPCWHWLANVSFASPLKLGKEIAERFVYMVKSGNYPAKAYTMAVSGVNAPVTTAGCTVLHTAEFLALWISGRALNPGIPLTGLVLTGRMDMKSGEANYWAFDALVRRLATCEFIGRWLGVSVSPGVAEYSPAKIPGLYATLEKAYLGMVIAAFTGCHPSSGIGHLEAGLTLSPVQFLLDREFAGGLKFLEPPVVNEEMIGLETILDVGFGIQKNYLETEHTLKNFRSCLWQPELFNPEGWTPESEEKILEKAKKRVNELVAQYRKPEIDPDKIGKAREVVERAKRKLLS
ncbi:MAG: trimethylamine methyltransferase family protein [Candidatus Omnitrophota bacterium]